MGWQLSAYTQRLQIWLIDRNFVVQIRIREALYSYRVFAHVPMTIVRFGVLWKRTRYMTQLFATPRTNKIYGVVEDVNGVPSMFRWSRALADALLVRWTPGIHLSVSSHYLVGVLTTHSAIFVMTLRR